ncbi:MAG: hypothetical protein ACOYB7_07225 [Mycobacterium sp.]
MNAKLRHSISAVVIAAGFALAAAPVAGASETTCRTTGGSTMCQKPGHASLHAEPTVRGTNGSLFGSAWLPGYGRGHLPPLLALD